MREGTRTIVSVGDISNSVKWHGSIGDRVEWHGSIDRHKTINGDIVLNTNPPSRSIEDASGKEWTELDHHISKPLAQESNERSLFHPQSAERFMLRPQSAERSTFQPQESDERSLFHPQSAERSIFRPQ